MGQQKDFSIRGRQRARLYGIQAVYQTSMAQTDEATLKQEFQQDNASRKTDWVFFDRLISGFFEHQQTIDATIDGYATHSLSSINPVDLAILRLGCFELLHCHDNPAKVVVNEYVNLASKIGTEEGHRFVNAMLDKLAKVCRKTETIPSE